MQTMLRGKHWITTAEWTKEELDTLLEVAFHLKREFGMSIPHPLLQHKNLYMMFFEQSTRTRNSTGSAMTHLGGQAFDLTPDKLQISHGETALDTARVLSRYGHGIAVRFCQWMKGNQYIRDIAANSRVPVVNLQCDVDHPCQTLADIMTIQEKFGRGKNDLKGTKFVISWTYAPSYMRPMSVPQGLVSLMPRFGMDVALAHPPEFKLTDQVLGQARAFAKASGSKFEVVHDMDEAFKGAHIVYPKSWGCMMTTADPKEACDIAAKYKGWICDQRRMNLTDDGVYMHCLPADRNTEVTDEVIDGPRSIVFDEAENRLHSVKAILALTMGGRV